MRGLVILSLGRRRAFALPVVVLLHGIAEQSTAEVVEPEN